MRLTWSTVSVRLLTWGTLWSRIALLPVESVKVSYRQIQNLLKPTSSGRHFVSQKTNLDKKIFHWTFFFKIPLFESGNWPPSRSIFHVRQENVGAALVGDLSQHFKCLNNHFSHYFWLLTQGNVPGFPDMSQHSSCDTLWRILMIIVSFANARLMTRVVEAGGRWGKKMINMWLRQCKTCSVLVKWYNWYNW